MECVRNFNNELSSLYEVKPPISKAKMTQITKSAIKGIKFYKHIVQSVEKFIQKCRPEYKVPGLYVVDSIVRQSRHQFGADKDVFGPRFVKNIGVTFQQLFKCPEDERPKIIRVLNLWQKNNVFPIEVIQPLMDLGNPNANPDFPGDAMSDLAKESPVKVKDDSMSKLSPWKGWSQGNEDHNQGNKTYAEMSTKNLEKFNKAEMSNALREEVSHSFFKNQIKSESEDTVKFNKKLLDFDYGDEEDEDEGRNEDTNAPNALALSMAQNLLSNPDLLRQLQQMATGTLPPSDGPQSGFGAKSEEMDSFGQEKHDSPHGPGSYPQPVMPPNLNIPKSDADDRILHEPVPPSRDLDERSLPAVLSSQDRLVPPLNIPAFATGVIGSPKTALPDKDDRTIPGQAAKSHDLDERSLAPLMPPSMPPMTYPENANLMQFQFDKNGLPYQPPPMHHSVMDSRPVDPVYPGMVPPDPHSMQSSQEDEDERRMYSMPGEPPLPPKDFDERQIVVPSEERNRRERSRSKDRGRSNRHRSRSRSPRRRRSSSRSRSHRHRSRSRERERVREKEKERERERERRRKGLPPIKKGCISVCSTTLWLGHVPKTATEADLTGSLETFGTIISIDMIPPRGCAYVVMHRRQDANRCLIKCRNMKLHGSHLKMAWAPGKGVKGKDFKDYWDVDLGVSYVPYDKVKEDCATLKALEEGGFIDEESLPENLKALMQQMEAAAKFTGNSVTDIPFPEMPPGPNMVPPPILPPTSVGLPMVLPPLLQPQFGLHLPGMLPPQAMVMQMPMGIPPPAPMLMQSQGIMGGQPLTLVGGVPPIVPHAIPPVANCLPSQKLPDSVPPVSGVPPVSSASSEAKTSNSRVPVTAVSSSTMSLPTSQAVTSMNQFSLMAGLSTNRPSISVPPPVSSAGTPIPFPPPNVGYSFPPPVRPPNSQFPWMQKMGENDSSKSPVVTSSVQPGGPNEVSSRQSLPDSAVTQDKKASTLEAQGESNSSDQHNLSKFDKSQDMVMSTDDECSMDTDLPRTEGPLSAFPPDFHRGPMDMARMRGLPPGPMEMGPRFPPGMGPPFSGMMSGPGMHSRMEMEFSPQHDPRGMRMPMGMRGPMMNDGMHPHGGRDWYPPDYEDPFFNPELDREMGFRDGWGRDPRDPWMPSEMGMDSRHGPRDFRDLDGEPRRDDRRDDFRRDDRQDEFRRDDRQNEFRRDDRQDEFRRDDRRDDHRRDGRRDEPRRDDRRDEHRRDSWRDEPKRDDRQELGNKDQPDSSKSKQDSNESSKKPKKSSKSKGSKNFMNDLFRLQKYQGGPPVPIKIDTLRDQSKPKSENVNERGSETQDSGQDAQSNKMVDNNETNQKTRDREQKKRSRWGRTLSEEREFEQQKQNEIELKQSEVAKKFQSYEQSHSTQKSQEGVGDTIQENPVVLDASGDVESVQPGEQVPLASQSKSSCSEVFERANVDRAFSDDLDSTNFHSENASEIEKASEPTAFTGDVFTSESNMFDPHPPTMLMNDTLDNGPGNFSTMQIAPTDNCMPESLPNQHSTLSSESEQLCASKVNEPVTEASPTISSES